MIRIVSILIVFEVITIFLSFPKEASCLKLIRVGIPPVAVRGEVTLLECQYDLEADRLYSVMWYKDHEEFYRFVPRNNPKQHSYRLEGFRVDHHLSNEQQVLLRNVNLKASGIYRCEVSAEAPSFTSVHAEGRMDIVALPKDGPDIFSEHKVYHVGDLMNLNCSSDRSYPPARLTWYINENKVGADYESVTQLHGLMKTVIGLTLKITEEHFEEGAMVVKCVSVISTGRNTVREQRIKPIIDNREALLLVQASRASVVSVTVFLLLLSLVS